MRKRREEGGRGWASPGARLETPPGRAGLRLQEVLSRAPTARPRPVGQLCCTARLQTPTPTCEQQQGRAHTQQPSPHTGVSPLICSFEELRARESEVKALSWGSCGGNVEQTKMRGCSLYRSSAPRWALWR